MVGSLVSSTSFEWHWVAGHFSGRRVMNARNNCGRWGNRITALVVGICRLAVHRGLKGRFCSWSGPIRQAWIPRRSRVGQTATINIRLDLIAGESWGSADVPLGVGTWLVPDDVPNFEITGFQTDGFIGPSFSYDRTGLPALPMSPEEYRLVTDFDGATPIDGPASIILDQLPSHGAIRRAAMTLCLATRSWKRFRSSLINSCLVRMEANGSTE